MWSSGTLVPVHSWGMPPYNKGTCANLISWFNLPLCSPYSFSCPVWIFVLGFLKKGKCISWKLDTFRDWVQILPHITSENNCGCGPISIPVCAGHKSQACFGACWVDCNSSHEHSDAGAIGCCMAGYRGRTEAVHLPLRRWVRQFRNGPSHSRPPSRGSFLSITLLLLTGDIHPCAQNQHRGYQNSQPQEIKNPESGPHQIRRFKKQQQIVFCKFLVCLLILTPLMWQNVPVFFQ